MKRNVVLTLVVCVALTGVVGCSKQESAAKTEVMMETEPAAEQAAVEVRHDLVYACNCGPACDCGSISTTPGTCSCGTELAPAHVVAIIGHDAKLCMMGPDCTCKIDPEDDSKCTCPGNVKTVNLDGKGLYFCNCGGSCTCNYVDSEPGTCPCGSDLTTG